MAKHRGFFPAAAAAGALLALGLCGSAFSYAEPMLTGNYTGVVLACGQAQWTVQAQDGLHTIQAVEAASHVKVGDRIQVETQISCDCTEVLLSVVVRPNAVAKQEAAALPPQPEKE